MSEELVEKVARALYGFKYDEQWWDECDPPIQARYQQQASAVIRLVLERAAEVAEDSKEHIVAIEFGKPSSYRDENVEFNRACSEIATAIRALGGQS